MKILIIGAQGLLGSELVTTFQDHEVLAWDRDEIDISDDRGTRDKVLGTRAELIVNAAAYNNVDGAETDGDLARAVNGYAVGYLAAAAKELGAVMVQYSTDFVFSGDAKVGYTEDATPDPVSVYGASKALGEELLAKKYEIPRQARDDKGGWYLIRTTRLYGALPAGHAGKKPFPDLMIELAGKKPYLEVVDEEVGQPTYTVDLAKATRDLVESGKPFGIYHRTNEGVCTWYGWAQEVFRIKNMVVDLRPVPRSKFPVPAKRPFYSPLLNTKLPPMRSWQEALEEYLLTN